MAKENNQVENRFPPKPKRTLVVPGYTAADMAQNVNEEKGDPSQGDILIAVEQVETSKPAIQAKTEIVPDLLTEESTGKAEAEKKSTSKETTKTGIKGDRVPFEQFLEKMPAKPGRVNVPCVIYSNLQEELKMIAAENKTSISAIHNQIISNWLNEYDGDIKAIRRALAKSRQ